MKKVLLFGAAWMIVVLLLGSCNKNRFDYSQLEGVQASGQWKFPVGTLGITINQVLNQLSENELVSFDSDGNLQITYHYAIDTVVSGKDFMSYNDMEYPVTWNVANPYPYVLSEPVDDTLVLEQTVSLDSDFLSIFSAVVRSGGFFFNMESTLGRIQKIVVKSPCIFFPDGTPFQHEISLEGVTPVDMADMRIVASEINTIQLFYDIYYEAYDYTEPYFWFMGRIGVTDFCVKEMTGWISRYSTPFSVDTPFVMPINNVLGDLKFVDAHLTISERKSFDLTAALQIDTAMLYGEEVAPTSIFDHCPVFWSIQNSENHTTLFDERLSLDINTNYDAVHLSGAFILNPDGLADPVWLCDTSTVRLAADVVIPFKLNVPGVTYVDTIHSSISDIDAPELVKEVILYMLFESEIPFNLSAQVYTLDPETEQITDSLFLDPQDIRGSFDGQPVLTNKTARVTRETLSHLMDATKLSIQVGLDTQDQDVMLNLDDKLRVTIKADVSYDGVITGIDL